MTHIFVSPPIHALFGARRPDGSSEPGGTRDFDSSRSVFPPNSGVRLDADVQHRLRVDHAWYSSTSATGSTVVSLNFDDGTEDQYTTAFPMLQSLNMHGTFFIISGYANNLSGYMTLPQLQALYNAGNEIGGHTVLHPYLTQVSTDEATREICDSRDTLLNWGFPVTDFDYPHSASNATLESIAQQCGYNSARSDGEITSPDGCLSGCPMAETIPPADPYLLRSPDSIQDTWSVADIESLVTQAENNGGGWVNMIFHHICDNACDPYSITPANLQTVLTWLQTQPVSIEPINQVIGGSVNPPVSAPQVAPAPPGTNGVVNPSLETVDPYNSGTPYCWTQSTTGTNNATFAETSNAHTGQVAEQINISSFTSGAARLIVKQDLGQCAPSVVAGDAYVMSGWYQSARPYGSMSGTEIPTAAGTGGWRARRSMRRAAGLKRSGQLPPFPQMQLA